MDDKTRLISMVNTRGRVMWVHAWEVDNLRRQGCKIIYNPKEEYYPQYDLSQPVNDKEQLILEEPQKDDTVEEDTEYLEAEEL